MSRLKVSHTLHAELSPLQEEILYETLDPGGETCSGVV